MAVGRYVATLPERLVRIVAALAGGAAVELTRLALPDPIRRSRLYQATIDRMLRIVVEWIGGVEGRYPAEAMPAGTLAMKKAAGNVVELASILSVGWSPLWLLAGVADLIGGSKAYLRALEAELKADGLVPPETSSASVDALLDRLEAASGVLADTIDIPPTSLAEARASLAALRAQATDLPSATELGAMFAGLQNVARRENRSVGDVSAAVGAAAARAGIELGNTHIFQFYRDALHAIADEGLPRYVRRVTTPYLAGAASHVRPDAPTLTGAALDRVGRRRSGDKRANPVA
ncbi:MAG TPA: hypothetical protein VFQ80_07240 [Thermomicrobiales bacterium]|jgi:hypothetical protein|nr:hypothetical protein [Thermomicrobiales bacterium]